MEERSANFVSANYNIYCLAHSDSEMVEIESHEVLCSYSAEVNQYEDIREKLASKVLHDLDPVIYNEILREDQADFVP